MSQSEMLKQMTVRSLKDIGQRAYDVFWDEKREHGNYEDACATAIDHAIAATVELMEPKPDEGEKSISTLYWEAVSN